jgi:hypothetical protein
VDRLTEVQSFGLTSITGCLEKLTKLSLWWPHLDLSMLSMEYIIGI